MSQEDQYCKLWEKNGGDFIVQSGQIIAIDPCYSKNTHKDGVLDVVNGLWHSKITFVNRDDRWGDRVASLLIFIDSEKDYGYLPCYRKCAVPVDSGQAGFFDYNEYPEQDMSGDPTGITDFDIFYEKACHITLSNKQGGTIDGIGVLTSSGYGDGLYDLYYKTDSQGKVTAAEIVFIDIEDEL